MASIVLGLDIGGANLKAATADKAGGGGRGEPTGGSPHPRAVSVPFPLWKQPDKLPAALAELVAKFPDADELAVTMTGELCDCFETKRDGVHAIIAAVRFASGGRPIHVWSTDGRFLNSEEAKRNHMKVAAANWHALATFAGHYAPEGRAILVDIGSTTTDIIPILDGVPVAVGKTDYDRLFSGELAYTGVRRTPVCAIAPWFVAAELFATTLDVYLVLGMVPEDPNDRDTADGRPATRKYARARLARMFCGDADGVPEDAVEAFASSILSNQIVQLQDCLSRVNGHLRVLEAPGRWAVPRPFHLTEDPPRWSLSNLLSRRLMPLLRGLTGKGAAVRAELVEEGVAHIVSGAGEFLAQRVINEPHHISLNDELGPEVSACAPAYAVAVLAAERRP
ncbi:hydantoinase/oxoprolinase family protein [Frigoriglobus tundricola]|uniref:4-[[4-(2-aminoethyl)phenoxy]-methyl]-2-furanmethanamine-glutamate synthase n=1 Tax=Frigoriglobus tundricola TaxID=2774151 RepID=A0A6M5YT69_9BACT|nr:hydantoinase/oxoprolinase family protein [Frigoriglobus tundricola]QJW97198.1 4-[[4-(2-aminoethyl)phenoxy]-methyl]-2-furanmethanamine-glutamate synthase [Frigoriglobus tundricola]